MSDSESDPEPELLPELEEEAYFLEAFLATGLSDSLESESLLDDEACFLAAAFLGAGLSDSLLESEEDEEEACFLGAAFLPEFLRTGLASEDELSLSELELS